MKKILSIVLSLFLVCSLAPISAFAASEDQSTAKVGVFVEVVDEDLSSLYDFSTPRRARSVVDLSAGQDTFTVGTLQANSTYRTNTYSITKSTIKIGLQSLAGASPHIKVTLYKSNGVSVAVTTMNLPWSSPMSGSTTYVSFTNLDTAYNYYAVIQNMDAEYYDMQKTFDSLYADSKSGEVFGHLMDIISAPNNIKLAFRNIKGNDGSHTAGTDGRTIESLAVMSEDKFVKLIQKQFRRYEPKAVKRVEIPKPRCRRSSLTSLLCSGKPSCPVPLMEHLLAKSHLEPTNSGRTAAKFMPSALLAFRMGIECWHSTITAPLGSALREMTCMPRSCGERRIAPIQLMIGR